MCDFHLKQLGSDRCCIYDRFQSPIFCSFGYGFNDTDHTENSTRTECCFSLFFHLMDGIHKLFGYAELLYFIPQSYTCHISLSIAANHKRK